MRCNFLNCLTRNGNENNILGKWQILFLFIMGQSRSKQNRIKVSAWPLFYFNGEWWRNLSRHCFIWRWVFAVTDWQVVLVSCNPKMCKVPQLFCAEHSLRKHILWERRTQGNWQFLTWGWGVLITLLCTIDYDVIVNPLTWPNASRRYRTLGHIYFRIFHI